MKQTLRRFTAIALCLVMITALLASCGEPTPTQPPVVTHVGFNGNTWNDNVDTGANVETVTTQDENGYYFVDHALALNKLDKRFMTELSLTKPVALTMGNSELKVSNRTYYANTDVKYIVVNVTTAGKLTVSKANVADFMAGKAELVSSKTVDATVGEFKIELNMPVGLDETIVLGSEADTAKIASYTVTTESADGLYAVSGGEAGDKRIAVNAAVEIYKEGTLFTDEQYATIEKYLYANMGALNLSVVNFAGYTYQVNDLFTNKRLTAITIPVAKLMKQVDGKFSFTINVIDSSTYATKRTYTIYFDAEKYGWKDTDVVYEAIEVDLVNYGIVIAENESISYLSANDTIYVATTSSSTAADVKSILSKNKLSGTVMNAGKEKTRVDNNTSMLFNVTYADLSSKISLEDNIKILKAEEAVAAEELKEIAYFDALRAYYKGKKVSIIGDSISTYNGFSNNAKFNSTMVNNIAYYYHSNNLESVDYTYWMRVINQLDMELCVPNGYSGSKVYDSIAQRRGPIRAIELHRDNGTPDDKSDDVNPDIIFMYIGINDLVSSMSFGDLSNRLKKASESEYNSIIEDWMKGVLESTKDGTEIVGGRNYKTFEQGYAIMLYNMVKKYEGAKIICCTLIPNKVATKDEAYDNYNRVIEALAAYFGASVADFKNEAGIDRTNYETYMDDPAKSVHPNAWGHDMMADVIIDTMAQMAGISK